MNSIDVRHWLEGWVEENLLDPYYRRDKSAMLHEAAACRAAAVAIGIDEDALTAAGGGDLPQFLFERQAVLVDERRNSGAELYL